MEDLGKQEGRYQNDLEGKISNHSTPIECSRGQRKKFELGKTKNNWQNFQLLVVLGSFCSNWCSFFFFLFFIRWSLFTVLSSNFPAKGWCSFVSFPNPKTQHCRDIFYTLPFPSSFDLNQCPSFFKKYTEVVQLSGFFLIIRMISRSLGKNIF